jgi:hypothetical protein
MRRRLHKLLPVVLAALVIQILAQTGTFWASALAVADPLASVPICHSSAESTPAGSNQGDLPGHDGSCALCCVLTAGASIEAPQPTTLATPLHREVETIMWGYEAPGFFTVRIGANSLARGPPQAT